ncbi:MAG: YggT family protein [Clostridia bacterium]|nr:YggT family protein [Clostridia bacterium]
MAQITYVLVRLIVLFIEVLLIAMLGRAVLSWFTMGEESALGNFLYLITEPVIVPFRLLCDRFGWFQGVPVDIPFLLTNLALAVISVILEVVYL